MDEFASAIANGDWTRARNLIRAGADVNATLPDGSTSLTAAAAAGRVGVVKALIDAGAAAGARDSSGRTAIRIAALRGHRKVFDHLLMYADGEDYDRAAAEFHVDGRVPGFLAAIVEGRIDEVAGALGAGVSPNAATPDEGAARGALYLAASRGRDAIVALLLETGADPDDSSPNGDLGLANESSRWTPLMAAARLGFVGVIRLLARAGADLEAADGPNGRRALMLAVEGRRPEAVAELIRAGADVDAADSNGKNALIVAAQLGDEECLALLREAGAVESPNLDVIALVAAVGRDELPRVRRLIAKTRDLDGSDPWGRTPLSAAASAGRDDVVRALLEAGADVNRRGGFDPPPLLRAAYYGHLEVVRTLVAAGADLNYDDDGMTALDYAVEGRHARIAKYLKSAAS